MKRTERLELIRTNPAHAEVIKSDDDLLATMEAAIDAPSVDPSQRIVSGMLTTQDVDQECDVIVTEGIDTQTYYPAKVKAVYWNHNYHDLPVGVCRKLIRYPRGLWQQTYVKPGAFGDDLLAAIEAGAVGHYSIVFKILEWREPTQADLSSYPSCERIITRSMAIEGSLVSMPANALAALDNLLVKGYIRRTSAVKMGLPDDPTRTVVAVGEAKKTTHATIDLESGIVVLPGGDIRLI